MGSEEDCRVIFLGLSTPAAATSSEEIQVSESLTEVRVSRRDSGSANAPDLSEDSSMSRTLTGFGPATQSAASRASAFQEKISKQPTVVRAQRSLFGQHEIQQERCWTT